MIGRSASHRTKRKYLQLDALAIQVGIGFIPINLGFDTPVVALRHKGLAPGQPQRFFALRHILPHRALGSHASRYLLSNALPYPLRRVALLARSLAIRFQNRVDELRRRSHLHMRSEERRVGKECRSREAP